MPQRTPRKPSSERHALALMKAALALYEETGGDAAEVGAKPASWHFHVALSNAAEKCFGQDADLWLERLARWIDGASAERVKRCNDSPETARMG